MKRRAHAFIATIAVAATIAITGAQAADVPGVTDTEIKVGSFGPLTGPVYIYGKLTMNGVEVYFNELNKKGGIFTGQLVIGNAGLTQAELLPETKPAAGPEADVIAPEVVPHPLPAT